MAHLDLIGIVARDISVSLRFYRLLGLNIPQEAEKESHIEITLSGGLRLAWDAFWGQRYTTVIDPDGNLVDLFAWK